MAGSVLVAVGDCDRLLDRIVLAAKDLRLGRDMGAIIDEVQRQSPRSIILLHAVFPSGATARVHARDGRMSHQASLLRSFDEGMFIASRYLATVRRSNTSSLLICRMIYPSLYWW